MKTRAEIQNGKSKNLRPVSLKLVKSTSCRRSLAKLSVGKTKLNPMFVGKLMMEAQMNNSKPVDMKWYRMSWRRTAALGN